LLTGSPTKEFKRKSLLFLTKKKQKRLLFSLAALASDTLGDKKRQKE
jgi:hypothetical protein